MAMDPITTGLLGGAAGWAGQWFLIDRPVLRKVEEPVHAPNLSAELQAKLDAAHAKLDSCMAERKKLEAEVQELKARNTELEHDLESTRAALASAKKDLCSARRNAGGNGPGRLLPPKTGKRFSP